MSKNRRIITIVTAGVLVAGGATAAFAGGALDDDTPITGEALQKASEAALAHTGGGEVTETEIEDEESYYEVEVTLEDGSQIDVQLDEDFNVVGEERDDEDDTNDDD